MSGTRANTVSLKDLSSKTEAAAKAASHHLKVQVSSKIVVGPGIIGFILRNERQELVVSQVEKAAEQAAQILVGAGQAASAISAGSHMPGFLGRPGHIIMGFFPVNPIEIDE